nr:unnamed protein product [Digitaria exilis]
MAGRPGRANATLQRCSVARAATSHMTCHNACPSRPAPARQRPASQPASQGRVPSRRVPSRPVWPVPLHETTMLTLHHGTHPEDPRATAPRPGSAPAATPRHEEFSQRPTHESMTHQRLPDAHATWEGRRGG